MCRRRREPAAGELELAELCLRPGVRLALVGRSVAGKEERRARAVEMAEQFPRIGDARIGGDAGLETRHRVERGECFVVAAELEQGVADDAVVPRRGR